jgi:hypothetical protein
MKISKKTFDILKNFSGIRSSIYVDKGNVIRTVSTAKNIMAEAKVDESFPSPFAIFDLGKFIATTSLFSEPDYDFNFSDKFVVVNSPNGSTVRYCYADSKLVEKADKTIKMPTLTAEFVLTANQITEIQRSASVLQLDTICIQNNGADIKIVAFDRKIGINGSSNQYSMVVKTNEPPSTFAVYLDIELLKMIPDDYSFQIGGSAVAKLTGAKNGVTYWIALRPETK